MTENAKDLIFMAAVIILIVLKIRLRFPREKP